MDFYFNENCLLKYQNKFVCNVKEIKEMHDHLKEKNYRLCIKYNLDIDYKKLSSNRNAMAILPFLKHLQSNSIDTSSLAEFVNENDITPKIINNYYFIELMSLCYRDKHELILSLINEDEILGEQYEINRESQKLNIKNVIGKSKLEEYCLYNPVPQSVSEVFEKAGIEFKHIKFTRKAFDTGESRSDIIKQFGFSNLLNIFKVLEELVYPFCKGILNISSYKELQNEFKARTNLEYSDESDSTMDKYGCQRDTYINGKNIRMRYHIKIKNDVRIYFKYIDEDDCIYIGHSGQHLDVAKKK